MTSTWQLLGLWHVHWDELLGILLLPAAYLWLCRLRPTKRGALLFGAGFVVMALSLFSPIGVLAEPLFSMHMVQHIGIALVAPPLFLLALPAERSRALLGRRALKPLARLLDHPPLCWLLGVGTMWLWHLPVLYDAAVASDPVHGLEHACFFASGLIFWWPVASPLRAERLSPASSMSYLFAGSMADGLLGILITFAAPGLYPIYQSPPDHHGALAFLRQDLSFSAAFDQQLGGLVMWVLGGGVLLGTILIVLVEYLRGHDVGDEDILLGGEA